MSSPNESDLQAAGKSATTTSRSVRMGVKLSNSWLGNRKHQLIKEWEIIREWSDWSSDQFRDSLHKWFNFYQRNNDRLRIVIMFMIMLSCVTVAVTAKRRMYSMKMSLASRFELQLCKAYAAHIGLTLPAAPCSMLSSCNCGDQSNSKSYSSSRSCERSVCST